MCITFSFVRIVFLVGLLVQVPNAFVGNFLPRRISAAVVDRFDLADNIWGMNNRMVVAENGNLTLRQTQSLTVPTPSFVHILTQGILTITSFSILRKGSIFKYDYSRSTGDDQQQTQVKNTELIHVSPFSLNALPTLYLFQLSHEVPGPYLWPNELNVWEDSSAGMLDSPVMLVSDGFILPGHDDGGLYAVVNPRSSAAQVYRITEHKPGWFYHRAVHVHLPGGRQGILTARATKPIWGKGRGELVWLSQPEGYFNKHTQQKQQQQQQQLYHHQSPQQQGWLRGAAGRVASFLRRDYGEKAAQTSTDSDGSASSSFSPFCSSSSSSPPSLSHIPWEETVLAEGPDVMFEVVDLDPKDDQLEVVSAQFFDEQIIVHAIRATDTHPFIEARTLGILPTVGRPYGLCLMTLPDNSHSSNSQDHEGDTMSSSTVADSATADQMTAGPGPSPPRFPPGRRPRNRVLSSIDGSVCVDSTHVDAHPSSVDGRSVTATAPTHLLVSTHECAYDMHINKLALGLAGLDMFPRIVAGAALPYRGHESISTDRHASATATARGSSAQSPRSQANTKSQSAQRPWWRMLPYMQQQVQEGSDSVVEDEGDSSDVSSEGGSLFAYELPKLIQSLTTTSSSATAASAAQWSSPSSSSSTPSLSPSSLVAASLSAESVSPVSFAPPSPVALPPPLLSWPRVSLFRGFKVSSWWGFLSPGAPGFPYVFKMPGAPLSSPPLILLSGDCTGSAYIFAPTDMLSVAAKTISNANDTADSATTTGVTNTADGAISSAAVDSSPGPVPVSSSSVPPYEMVFEIQCGATVGSAAVAAALDGSGDVDIFIPSYELNKIHKFQLAYKKKNRDKHDDRDVTKMKDDHR